MKYLLIIVCFLVSSNIYAEEYPTSAFSRLINVGKFAFGGVGYSGAISQGEKDFLVIFESTSPVPTLINLYESGNIQAKCYALVGLQTVDPHTFRKLLRKMKNETDEVTIMRGCIVNHEPVSQVIIEIEKGVYSTYLDETYFKKSTEQKP